MYGKSRFSSQPALAAHNLSLSDGIRFLLEWQNVVKSIVLDKRDKNFTTKQIKHKFRFLLTGKSGTYITYSCIAVIHSGLKFYR